MDISSVRRSAPLSETPAQLLSELQEAHQLLLEAMTQLDTLTRGLLPSKAEFVDARWKISRASLARRSLWRRVYDYLSPVLAGREAIELKRLYDVDMALLRSSSEHVAKWKIDALIEDWASYCAASVAIRWRMKAAIGAEIRVVYPLLRNG